MQQQRIMLINETSGSQDVIQAVAASNHLLAGCYNDSHGLVQKVDSASPEVLIIVVDTITSNLIDELSVLFEHKALPIILFTNDSNEASIVRAVEAGVTSYIFNGLGEDRIDPIIQMALLRFEQVQQLKCEVEKVETRLNDRILIDRAKGMLMDYQGMKEQDAYRALQKTAMDQATTIVDIAEKTITVLESMNLKKMA